MVYVAFLRGINVGGNSRVEMARLKQVFELLGFPEVVTYINSGNVIFRSDSEDTKALVRKIERAIKREFDLNIKVIVRDIENIRLVNESIPNHWTNDTNMKSDVMFLWEEVDSSNILKQLPTKPETETVKYVSGAVLWSIDRTNATKNSMLTLIGTDIYKKMTIRNVNTARKILGIMESLEK